MRKVRQIQLPFRPHGGKRKNAGRKPKGKRPRVSHVARPSISAHEPLHITLRFRDGLPSLREERLLNTIRAILVKAKERFGLRIVQYSIQTNHIHFVVEAVDRHALSKGMRGLDIRLGRRVNGVLRRRGPVLADRYHSRALKTPKEVRNVLVYVLNNWRHHTRKNAPGFDLASSAVIFDGWIDGELREKIPPEVTREIASTCVPPDRWLLKRGWKRHGLIRSTEMPK